MATAEATTSNKLDAEAANPTVKINNKSVEQVKTEGLGLVIEATKYTNAFPANASRNLYSAHPTFHRVTNTLSDKMLSVISKVIKLQNIKGNIQRRDNDEKVELLLECNDIMLERINSNLDILSGIRQYPEQTVVESEMTTATATLPVQNPEESPLSGSWNENRRILTAKSRTAKLLTARNIVRPQIKFKTPVDNSTDSPFVPQLKYKPNSIKPLAILPEYNDDGTIESYLHPYEMELQKFAPNEGQLQTRNVIKPLELDETPLMHVNNTKDLEVLMEELMATKEIAIDVEHHSYRTFQGITCLMQVSTRTKDYIIDTLALREDLHVLNEVFTDPKIVKVFHGADSDIEWLQRDLSIYIVNMFDTHQAAKRLNFARLSLAFLLKHFCLIEADKSFQLADWRMRPLPEELVAYARQDTHYLLYIYDMLTNQLIEKANGKSNWLENVYQLSAEVCGKRYNKIRIAADSHLELYRKSKRVFDNRQFFALKELYLWRDTIARIEDESYAYVLPNHMLLQIAENLPREMQGILACCNPIPPLVRQNLHALHRFILQAREQPLNKIVLDDQALNRSTLLSNNQQTNNHLYCPIDTIPNAEFRDDLPTLLGNAEELESNMNMLTMSVIHRMKPKGPTVSVFHLSSRKDKMESLPPSVQAKFISPYERYLAVLPFAEQERLDETAKLAEENRKRKLCPDAVNITVKVVGETPATPTVEAKPVALKHYGKDEVSSPAQQPPEKRRRLEESVESKLLEIRQNMDKSTNSSKRPASDPAQTPKSKKKKNKSNQPVQTGPSPSSLPKLATDFDYSSIDYKAFGGGSQKPKNDNEVKSKFKGKGKGNQNQRKYNNFVNSIGSNKRK